MDFAGFAGGNLFSSIPGAKLVSNQLYQYIFDGWGPSLGQRKAQGTLALSGTNPLRDISGPGSLIGDTVQDSYTYCVAYLGNECRTGSRPGDAFANVPNLKHQSCTFGDEPDLCIGAFPTFAQGVVQLGLLPNQVGEKAGSGTSGAGYSRVLTGGLVGLRQTSNYPLAKALPDGSWSLFQYSVDFHQIWMVKMPPFLQNDALDRSGFLPLRVDLVPPADPRIQTAVIEFGYAEQGAPDQRFCTSRREACVAVSPVLSQSDPFKYVVSDQYTGAPCKGSCTITLPVLPMHVVYFRAKYLDASGVAVAFGPARAGAEVNASK